MRKQKNYKRIHKSAKIFGAAILGALIVSGSAFAMPAAKKAQYNSNEVMCAIQSSIPSDSSYIDQWNKEFSSSYKEFDEKRYLESFKAEEKESMNEGAVKEALKNKDYEAWKDALADLEGYPQELEVLPEEEFNILTKIK
jgi:hypothetical protein